MPQSSRMMVTFCACFSQAATSPAAAPAALPFEVEACGAHATEATMNRKRTSFFIRGILLVRTQELQDQAADLRRLLLLHPMACTGDEVYALHLRARGRLHAFDGARVLIHAPIALAADEHRGHVDGAARERLQLRREASARSDAVSLQPALEPVSAVLLAVHLELAVGQPRVRRNRRGGRHLRRDGL